MRRGGETREVGSWGGEERRDCGEGNIRGEIISSRKGEGRMSPCSGECTLGYEVCEQRGTPLLLLVLLLLLSGRGKAVLRPLMPVASACRVTRSQLASHS